MSARSSERVELSNIREGEYEGLSKKLLDPRWKPDFGPAKFNPRSGATVTGAREFLIAYNVNLDSNDLDVAKEIACLIRESGRIARAENGKPLVGNDGKKIRIPGRLKAVKAMGVRIEQYGIVQVSMNLTNYKLTPIHVAFETVREEAQKFSIKLKGSEIVGLVPKDAILQAGRYYCKDHSRLKGKVLDESMLINFAIDGLGLNALKEFIPQQKIIEFMI
jgi:glutamate formiminotransferase/formiminotetrahydrofolate cyclodeaminase